MSFFMIIDLLSMIEVEADILRGSCTPVFFVGETIECEIKFKCLPPVTKGNSGRKKRNESTAGDQTPLTSLSALTEHYLSSTQIDNTKMNEINDSMFAMLSNLSVEHISSSTSSSIPTSPVSTPCSSASAPFYRFNSKSAQSFISDYKSDSEASIDSYSENIVAWACAQIDCHCFIDESKVILPKDPLRYNNSNKNNSNDPNNMANSTNSDANSKSNEVSTTSFQPNKDRVGISVFSSKPKILFCNLVLKPNQTRTCKNKFFTLTVIKILFNNFRI